MSTSGPRIPYIRREEWTDGARDVFAVMARDEAAREAARDNGSKMNIVNVLAHHPRIAVPYLEMNKCLYDLRLPMRLREIAVLRLAHLGNSAYEWFQHEGVGKRIGFSDADIAAIKAGKPATGWSEIDGLVMDAVTELEQGNTISDALWAGLGKHFDRELLFEFVFVISAYKMTSWIVNALAVPVEGSVSHSIGLD